MGPPASQPLLSARRPHKPHASPQCRHTTPLVSGSGCCMQVCQTHFLKMLSRPQAREVASRDDAVMWLWRAHNEVGASAHELGEGVWGPPAWCLKVCLGVLT
jgi:hypothetical protein